MIIRIFLLSFLIFGSANSADVSCEDYPNDCVKIENMDLPESRNELQKTCKELENTIECYMEWGKKCKTPQQLSLLRGRVTKPFSLQHTLCTNATFTREYFLEMDNIVKVSTNWNTCYANMRKNVDDPDASKNLELHMCCALERYKDCTKNLCTDKCSDGANKIVNKLNKQGQEYIRYNCNDVKVVLDECPNASSFTSHNLMLAVSMIAFLVLSR